MRRSADLMVGDEFGAGLGEVGCGPAAATGLFVAVDDEIAGAFDAGIEGDDVLTDSAGADDGFDGGTGLVRGLRRAVEERIVEIIGGQGCVELIEVIEIVGGKRNQGADFTGGNVDDDGRAVHFVVFENDIVFVTPYDAFEGIFDVHLEVDVDG